jgi:hypothetical protein
MLATHWHVAPPTSGAILGVSGHGPGNMHGGHLEWI